MDVAAYINDIYPEEELMTIDGFDEAFIGVGTVFNETITCYDRDRIIGILMERDRLTQEDAEEYLEFNIAGAYMGKKTPILISIVESEKEKN
jgi:hypothetical protein